MYPRLAGSLVGWAVINRNRRRANGGSPASDLHYNSSRMVGGDAQNQRGMKQIIAVTKSRWTRKRAEEAKAKRQDSSSRHSSAFDMLRCGRGRNRFCARCGLTRFVTTAICRLPTPDSDRMLRRERCGAIDTSIGRPVWRRPSRTRRQTMLCLRLNLEYCRYSVHR